MSISKPLWSPSAEFIKNSNLQRYIRWLNENNNTSFHDYHSLWEWSVKDIDSFWESIWEYFNILHDGHYTDVLSGNEMPDYTWFEGTRLNYSEHIFRNKTDQRPAIIHKSESGNILEISWAELAQQTAAVRHYLKSCGVKAGDRVAAFIPCIPEATIAFLAVNSLGAIWSSCSPDFGTNSVIDRFAQIEPKILIAVNGYAYSGKFYDKADVINDLAQAMPCVEKIIVLKHPTSNSVNFSTNKKIILWEEIIQQKDTTLQFDRVPFDHPIWVLYSSGTTGLPKPIVHSHGGILLEQLKYGTFHNDFKPGERCFWYTTTGWMMWNYIQGCLLTGGILVLYDGNPAYPDLNVLWRFAQDAGIHHFGTSAGYILANKKKSIQPGKNFTLTSLRSIGSTGSTLPPEGFDWIYKEISEDLWLTSMSGGTDICSAFVGGNPLWPVYPGEIQCRALGCKLEAYNEDGNPAIMDEVGEMVITAPMPSMPIYFWNDPEKKRYKESYFDMFPGIWRHGDWIRITSHNGVVIYGRSDATLNRGGVRIGTSEIYRAVDKIHDVKDSLIICIEKPGGEFWMPLFVVMKEGIHLTDSLKKEINTTIRNDYSPRHVPDEIIPVPDIPYTISGKKTETPVKKVLMGNDPEKVLNTGALKNPESMEFFIQLAKTGPSNDADDK